MMPSNSLRGSDTEVSQKCYHVHGKLGRPPISSFQFNSDKHYLHNVLYRAKSSQQRDKPNNHTIPNGDSWEEEFLFNRK